MTLTSAICEYDPQWPAKFEVEKKSIEVRLGKVIEAIHHIGSTAVAGIMAKPEIDLLILVKSMDEIDTVNAGMSTLGYDVRGESGIPGRYYYSKNVDLKRTHKAHVCTVAHRIALELIVFRDYLRDNPDEAKNYEKLKIDLAGSNRSGMREYLDGKEAYIRAIVNKAIDKGYGIGKKE